MTTDQGILDSFVEGDNRLSHSQDNDALLARLDRIKKRQPGQSSQELLHDTDVSGLVNELVLANEGWLRSAIAANIRRQPHLRRATIDELYSAALTGTASPDGPVRGAMRAIVEYDYGRFGTKSFTRYLAAAIHNALQPTRKQQKDYRQLNGRIRSLEDFGEDGPGRGWVARTTPPAKAAIDRELLQVVRAVIPRLPTEQQRDTAAWLVERILATGQMPIPREAAQRQHVSRERGRQIMEATVNNIRRQIETDYPQLVEHGINGWVAFKKAFDRPSPVLTPS